MNVYVRELASAMARQGHQVEVFTRRDSRELAPIQLVEPGFRVHHVAAGPARLLERHELADYVKDFSDQVAAHFERHGIPDALHANYWLSGLAGHRLKHELHVPLIMTFHTLERVKADHFEGESEDRAHQEAAIFACADAVLASCDVEAAQFVEYYNADPERVHVVPLGVQHAFFAPGDQRAARQALGRDENDTMLLFVGRLQALKGVELALDTLVTLRRRGRDVSLAIVGGPSGPEGARTLANLHERVSEAGVIADVSFVAPQSHQLLSSWMRAADVTLVPSRSESFGLVALESSACGTPVVASAVGGLLTLVDTGVNGQLVAQRDAEVWADAVDEVMLANADSSMSNSAVILAQRYTWRSAAQSLDALVGRLMAAGLVRC
jgi:D-inositol-3-phosphate glycosyltransferase